MEMLKELLKKKAGKGEIDPKYKDAKMSVLQEIRDMAAGDMGDEIKGLKKVSVAAPDQAGLEKGLAKAKSLVEGSPEEEAGESPSEEAGEGDENPSMFSEHPSKIIADEIDHESAEGDLSSEEIDALIMQLQAKKAELSKKPE